MGLERQVDFHLLTSILDNRQHDIKSQELKGISQKRESLTHSPFCGFQSFDLGLKVQNSEKEEQNLPLTRDYSNGSDAELLG